MSETEVDEAKRLAAELNEYHVDEVSDALCSELSSGKLGILRIDFDEELLRRFEAEQSNEGENNDR